MYANQQDGGGSAATYFSGGGFMPSQATQTTDQGTSSKNRSATSSTTVPVTVKQVSEAYHSNDDKSDFLIDGVDPSTVRLLGRVENKAERVTDVSFTLDDGTGRVEINRWVNDPFDTTETAGIENGIYAVVCGRLKGFQGKRHIVAHSVRPVQDFNQITLHFMECIHAHLDNSRAKIPGKAAAANTAAAAPVTPAGMHDARAYQTPIVGAGAGVTGDAREVVLSAFNEPASLLRDNGLHVEEIMGRLGLPEYQIREAIEYHVEVGNIYSTIDDYHYKSACNG